MLNQALDYAADRGVHVVAAAGNDDTDEKQYPASEGDVLSVSSTTLKHRRISAFANWGKWVDVAAPADRLVGPVPGGRYARWAGTSMAAPQVSGQLALLIAAGAESADDREKAVNDTTREVTGKKIGKGLIDVLSSLGHVRSRS